MIFSISDNLCRIAWWHNKTIDFPTLENILKEEMIIQKWGRRVCCILTDIFEDLITILTVAPHICTSFLLFVKNFIVFLYSIKNAMNDSYQVHFIELQTTKMWAKENIHKKWY